ncbi:uncharacterized protein LOC120034879 isoform X2 [Salvelinus namaycush]|uniref:Uncharacterized protein LOC120034879 isoform X2 n=1 Tax=Salvelinus namaycush TaxID=8040 RepID=A0A8U0Q444_SALNM|nr:uncharacterized protein LOC120034879 isoform X2 [Salvelinus namaycush]
MGEQGGWQEDNREDWSAILDSQTQTGAKGPVDDITEQARTRGDIVEGRDRISEVAGDKPWPRIRSLDQESLLFLPESEPGPNYEIQRLSTTTTQNTTSGQVDRTSSVLVIIKGAEAPVCRTDPSLHSLSAGMKQGLGLIEIDPPVPMIQTPQYP